MLAAIWWGLCNIATAIVVITFLWTLFFNLIDGEGPLTAILYSVITAITIIPISIVTIWCYTRSKLTDK